MKAVVKKQQTVDALVEKGQCSAQGSRCKGR